MKIAALGGLSALVLGEHPEKVDAGISSAGIGIAGVTSGVVGAFIGVDNNNSVTDDYGVVTGGQNNQAGDNSGTTSDRDYATVGGGYNNRASGYISTVGGGSGNAASNAYATVGGGNSNSASGSYSMVGGGQSNAASSRWSTVGGGESNTASNEHATVGGGRGNAASGIESTVGGGGGNAASGGNSTVSGGGNNKASNSDSTVGGGNTNTASGDTSTVPGGYNNTAAGNFSFAAGRQAKVGANDHGTFLFADSNTLDFNSARGNEFAVRCTGGARFVTAIDSSTGNPTMSFAMTPTGNMGIGTTNPVRQLHIQGNNAVARLDRDADSASFIFVRTAAGNFNTVWKSFTFGVKATDVDNGSFFIGDMHQNVTGSSDNRILIDTSGNVGIGTTTPQQRLHVAGNVKATGFITGDVTFANGVRATEEGDGLAFVNGKGNKIAVLDEQGNFHIKGDIIKDL